MSNYLKKAQEHSEKIDYYYKHAGTAGYSQAIYHRNKLSELLAKANQSSKGRNDVPMIHAIIQFVDPKMKEMQQREKE